VRTNLAQVGSDPHGAPIDLVRAKCLDAGMSTRDADEVIELLRKVQAGRRLVPQSSYKGFRFSFPVE